MTINSKWLINAKIYKYIWIDKLEGYLMVCRNAYIWVICIYLWYIYICVNQTCDFENLKIGQHDHKIDQFSDQS